MYTDVIANDPLWLWARTNASDDAYATAIRTDAAMAIPALLMCTFESGSELGPGSLNATGRMRYLSNVSDDHILSIYQHTPQAVNSAAEQQVTSIVDSLALSVLVLLL